MTETVNVGIDFGTSNSVVAVWRNGRAEVVTNSDGHLITPSVLAFNRFGEILVGESARQQLIVEPGDAFTGVKRHLSGNETWTPVSFSDKVFTMPEVAGLILTDLRRTVADFMGQDPEAAVVTIPAAFGEIDKAVLIRACESAGFHQVTLVQEPVAAGLAYGWDGIDETPFLVYDIGGGTFDLSLMQVVEGQLIVRAHAGVAALGGRELDQQILERLLLPNLDVATQDLSERREVLLNLCESAKIRLSRADSVAIPIEGKVRNRDGLPIEDVVTIERMSFEPFVSALVDETVPSVLRLLAEAHLEPQSLSSIVLVGGPSRTPQLRTRLNELFPIKLETRLNPLTVVAQGAALYAGGIKKQRQNPRKPVQVGGVHLRLEYDSIASHTEVAIGIAVDDPAYRDGSLIMLKRTDGEWQSGWIKMQEGVAVGTALISSEGESEFQIEMIRADGSAVGIVDPSSFTISKGIVAAPPPLSEQIGVLIEDATGQSIEFDVLAKRGDPTPLIRRRKYRTTRTLAVGDDAPVLEVNFRQGPHIKPVRNRVLGTVTLRGSDLERSLPAGSEVEITLRIDPAASPRATVYVPAINRTWDNKLDEPSYGGRLSDDLRVRLETEHSRIEEFKEVGIETAELERAAETSHHDLLLAETGDRDSLARAGQAVSRLELEGDQVEHQNASILSSRQLQSRAETAALLVDQFGSDVQKARLDLLQSQMDSTSASRDSQQTQSLSDSFLRLGAEVWYGQPAAWVYRLEHFEQDGQFTDPVSAGALMEAGRSAIELGDVELLKRVVLQLHDLSVDAAFDTVFSQFGGLRRK